MKGVNYSLESFIGPVQSKIIGESIANAVKQNKDEVCDKSINDHVTCEIPNSAFMVKNFLIGEPFSPLKRDKIIV